MIDKVKGKNKSKRSKDEEIPVLKLHSPLSIYGEGAPLHLRRGRLPLSISERWVPFPFREVGCLSYQYHLWRGRVPLSIYGEVG